MRETTVVMMPTGEQYRVPVEHAAKFIRKNELVRLACFYQDQIKTYKDLDNTDYKAFLDKRLGQVMAGIRRLNRQIPPCAERVS